MAHPVARITQPRTHAAMTGRRYGSFAGKTSITQFTYTGIPAIAASKTLAIAAGKTMTIEAR